MPRLSVVIRYATQNEIVSGSFVLSTTRRLRLGAVGGYAARPSQRVEVGLMVESLEHVKRRYSAAHDLGWPD